MNAERIKRAASGCWPDVLAHVVGIDPSILDGRHHPCPRRGGNDRFRLIDSEAGAVFCNQCFDKKNGDGIAAVQWMLGCSFQEALGRIARYLGIEATKRASANSELERQVEWITPANGKHLWLMLHEWRKRKPPVTVESLLAVGARIGKWPAKKKTPFFVIAFPGYRDPDEPPCGWILYCQDGKQFPPVGNLPRRKTHCLRGSKDGWVVVGGWERLKSAHTVVRVEGIPDALAVYPYLPEGHVVVTNITGANASAKLPMTMFQGKRMIVIGDADHSGQEGTQEFALLIGADLYTLPTGWHHPECMRFLFIPLPEGHPRWVNVNEI